jgi:hypothetical protein
LKCSASYDINHCIIRKKNRRGRENGSTKQQNKRRKAEETNNNKDSKTEKGLEAELRATIFKSVVPLRSQEELCEQFPLSASGSPV